MFCADCVRNWNAERALVCLIKNGLSNVFYGCGWWSDVSWSDSDQEQQHWVSESPGSAVRRVQHHLQRMSTCQSDALSWVTLTGPATTHTWSWWWCRRSFSIAWKGFGVFCNAERAGAANCPSSFLYKYWSVRSRNRARQLDKDSPIPFFVPGAVWKLSLCGQEQPHLSCVTFPVLLWEPDSQISADKGEQSEESKAELQPWLSKHWRFLFSLNNPCTCYVSPVPARTLSHCCVLADKNGFLNLKLSLLLFSKSLSVIMILDYFFTRFFLQIGISL